MESVVDSGEINVVSLFHNGNEVYWSRHTTYSKTGLVESTSGREVTLEVSQGDNIELRALFMEGSYILVNICAEYVPKM